MESQSLHVNYQFKIWHSVNLSLRNGWGLNMQQEQQQQTQYWAQHNTNKTAVQDRICISLSTNEKEWCKQLLWPDFPQLWKFLKFDPQYLLIKIQQIVFYYINFQFFYTILALFHNFFHIYSEKFKLSKNALVTLQATHNILVRRRKLKLK